MLTVTYYHSFSSLFKIYKKNYLERKKSAKVFKAFVLNCACAVQVCSSSLFFSKNHVYAHKLSLVLPRSGFKLVRAKVQRKSENVWESENKKKTKIPESKTWKSGCSLTCFDRRRLTNKLNYSANNNIEKWS